MLESETVDSEQGGEDAGAPDGAVAGDECLVDENFLLRCRELDIELLENLSSTVASLMPAAAEARASEAYDPALMSQRDFDPVSVIGDRGVRIMRARALSAILELTVVVAGRLGEPVAIEEVA